MKLSKQKNILITFLRFKVMKISFSFEDIVKNNLIISKENFFYIAKN